VLDKKGILYKGQPPHLPQPLGDSAKSSNMNEPTAQDVGVIWQIQRVSSSSHGSEAVDKFVWEALDVESWKGQAELVEAPSR